MHDDTKLSMTSQRQVILDELRKVTSHPTADEVYEMVRKVLPRISLGTVYRNLEILSEKGIIQKLHVGGTQMRFDGNPKNHPHIRCSFCGCVDDISFGSAIDVESLPKDIDGYHIDGYNLEFFGVCSNCISKS